MQREFARSYTRLMQVKINDLKGRNHDVTARRNHRGGPSQARLSPALLLRLLDLGDGVAGWGEADLIAGMQGVERHALHLELLHGAATAARTNGAVLRLLNRDRAVEPVNLGDHPGLRVLRKGG